MQACWLTDAEATSRLASETDSSSDTEDTFASADEDEGELEENESFLRMAVDFVYSTRLAACYYGQSRM